MRRAMLYALGVVAVAVLVRAPNAPVAAAPLMAAARSRALPPGCTNTKLNGKYAFYRTGITPSATTVVGAVGFQYYGGNQLMQTVQWTNKNQSLDSNSVIGIYQVNADCSFALYAVTGTLPSPCGNPASWSGGHPPGACNISDITPYKGSLVAKGVIASSDQELFLVSAIPSPNPVVNVVAKLTQ